MVHKVGIYSGTFDPVHAGHIAFAQEALKRCRLDKVFFLVEPRPRRKQGVKALEHRQNMMHLAVKHEPGLGQIILDHKRFTVAETLPVLQARFKGAQIYFLMGDDMLTHFTDAAWPHLDDFVKSTNLIIGVRKRSVADVHRHIALLEKTRSMKFKYEILETSFAKEASSNIRTKIRQGQKPEEISLQVYKYILNNGLYSSSEDS